MVLTYPQISYFLDNYESIKNLEELDLTYDQVLQIRQIIDESPSRQSAKDLIVRTKIQGILDKFSQLPQDEAEIYKEKLNNQLSNISNYPGLNLTLSSEEISKLTIQQKNLYYELQQLMRYQQIQKKIKELKNPSKETDIEQIIFKSIRELGR